LILDLAHTASIMMSLARAALVLLAASAFRVRKRGNKSAASYSSRGYIVTMGDSYASGTGIHKYTSSYHEGDECCRDFKTTPGSQLAKQEGQQHLIPACASDELPDISQQFSDLQRDYPQEASRKWEGSTMMLTIGGNDIRSNDGSSWPGILINCIISFYTDCHKKHANQVANFGEVQNQLADFYTTLAQGAGKATIRIWGYPRLLQRTWHCIPVPGVNSGATKWMDNMVDELNGNIKQAVDRARSGNPGVDIEFVDVTPYATKGACTISGNHIHSIVLNLESLLSPMTFHPSQSGYNAYYDALANNLGRSLPMSSLWPGSPEPWNMEHMFKGWDQDSDGKLSLDDVLLMGGDDATPDAKKILQRSFNETDTDQSGFLTLGEFEFFLTQVENS